MVDRIKQAAIRVADPDAVESAEELAEQTEPSRVVVKDNGEPDVDGVETADPESAMLGPFNRERPDQTDRSTAVDDIRKTGISVDAAPDPDAVMDRFERQQQVAQRIQMLESVNERLRKKGYRKRFVASDGDLPDDAIEFESTLGTYYYKTNTYRPSELMEDLDSWRAMNDDQKIVKTVSALVNVYPMFTDDVAGTDAASDMVDSVLVDETDTTDRYDVFDRSTVEAVGKHLRTVDMDNEST